MAAAFLLGGVGVLIAIGVRLPDWEAQVIVERAGVLALIYRLARWPEPGAPKEAA